MPDTAVVKVYDLTALKLPFASGHRLTSLLEIFRQIEHIGLTGNGYSHTASGQQKTYHRFGCIKLSITLRHRIRIADAGGMVQDSTTATFVSFHS